MVPFCMGFNCHLLVPAFDCPFVIEAALPKDFEYLVVMSETKYPKLANGRALKCRN